MAVLQCPERSEMEPLHAKGDHSSRLDSSPPSSLHCVQPAPLSTATPWGPTSGREHLSQGPVCSRLNVSPYNPYVEALDPHEMGIW